MYSINYITDMSRILIVDDFCPKIEQVRESALQSGFGTWAPNKGRYGSSIYENMNFWGLHSPMLKSLARAIGHPFYPNDMFFRYALPETEKAYTHSDRTYGDITCVAYLSSHDEPYGTGFYKHRKTGLSEMPPVDVMASDPKWQELEHDMIHGGDGEWELVDYCQGKFNRAVIFHAPLFHARRPIGGIGKTAEDGRMIWATHGVL
jgi:hypothetical protein